MIELIVPTVIMRMLQQWKIFFHQRLVHQIVLQIDHHYLWDKIVHFHWIQMVRDEYIIRRHRNVSNLMVSFFCFLKPNPKFIILFTFHLQYSISVLDALRMNMGEKSFFFIIILTFIETNLFMSYIFYTRVFMRQVSSVKITLK